MAGQAECSESPRKCGKEDEPLPAFSCAGWGSTPEQAAIYGIKCLGWVLGLLQARGNALGFLVYS